MKNDEGEIFENRIINLPQYLNSSELAQVLGVSVHTVRYWRKQRVITPKTFGRSVRWLPRDVLRELEQKG